MTSKKTNPAPEPAVDPQEDVDPGLVLEPQEETLDDLYGTGAAIWIRYTGSSDARTFTKQDLLDLGVQEPQSDLTWDGSNNKAIRIAELTPDTVHALLRMDGFEAF